MSRCSRCSSPSPGSVSPSDTTGYLTHGSFKANRPLHIALAVAGGLAIEGPVIRWVADHRRHHAFSDREGDPHSPWRYGNSIPALMKGFWLRPLGWLFDVEHTNREKFAPDLLGDRDIVRVDRLFVLWTAVSVLGPMLLGGLITWSWAGALSALFWASLVRIFVVHHVTWSINSVCHTIGERPFAARDKSSNFWPLAVISFGESWHNTAPRRSRPRLGTGCCVASSTRVRAADLDIREAGLGERCSVAAARAAGPAAGLTICPMPQSSPITPLWVPGPGQ